MDAADFAVVAPDLTGASVTGVTGSGAVYTVTVSTGTGAGTMRLDLVGTPSIMDVANHNVAGPFAGQIYTVREPIFTDVSDTYWATDYINSLYNSGITAGCGGGSFCPEAAVTRSQMAIFIVRAVHGVDYVPPVATGVFGDVAIGSFGADYIEQLYADGITAGCGGGNFCPDQEVSRSQMAIFLVRATHASGFVPPVATGLFNDVPVGSFAADYIEQLSIDGVTAGCGDGNFCPNVIVSRAQMAVFITKAFNLP